MSIRHSSPFDGPDYFKSSLGNVDMQDHIDTPQESEAQDQPLLAHDPVGETSGKHSYLKGLVSIGSTRMSKVTKNISAQRRKAPKSAADSASTPQVVSHWEYDRFHGSVPDSMPELVFQLNQGRHPEILELAIRSKQRLTLESEQNTFEYKLLHAMLVHIKHRRQNKELDAIQSKTLEELGRLFDYTRFP
jgi:hypothetical protein